MNQISTPQAQGQHPVPQQAVPFRHGHPHPQGTGYSQGFDSSGVPMFINQYPALVIPSQSQITTSMNENGHTMVNVYATPVPHSHAGGYPIHPGFPQPMYQQQYMPPQPQQTYQPPPPTIQQQQKPPQRAKRILSIIDPNSHEKVSLPQQDQKSDVSLSSSPQPKPESHTPVNESKEASMEREDVNAQFSRAIANRVVASRLISQNEDKHEISPAPAVESAPIEPVKEKSVEPSPPVKESTPIAESEPTTTESPISESAPPPAIVLEEAEAETSGVQDDKSEIFDPALHLDRAALIEHYESKVGGFFALPQNTTDVVVHKVYSRQLLQLVRDIIKNFNTVPCPLTEEKLKKIGIDRATMPAPPSVSHNKTKFPHRDNNFNPVWASSAQNNVRRGAAYVERPSKNNKNKARAPITGRPSIQRTQVKLTRGANAWTPDVLKRGSKGDQGSLEARTEKVRKEVRGLLNKVTPSTYKDLSTEMINKALWKDEETLPTVVELIFIKAVEEPTFVRIYADLCQELHSAEHKMEGKNFARKFYSAIVRKCQTSFEGTALSSGQEAINKIENEIKEETDEKKIAELTEFLEEAKSKEKRRMLGTIRFISHLFRITLLNYKIIEHCILILLKNAESMSSELMVEYSVHLIESVGPFIKTDVSKIDDYVQYLDKFKPTVSNRVRFLILGLEDLKNKNWAQKKDGPKTKEEVKQDVMKEEEQNKRERDIYAAHEANDPRRNRGPIISRPSYGGRQSSDSKRERLRDAVVAASTTGSSNVRKDIALNKVDQQGKLSAQKKQWGTPANNTVAASPGPRSRNMPPRNSIDARQPGGDARKQSSQMERKAGPTPPKADLRAASATPPLADASSSRSQNNSPTFTPENKYQTKEFKAGFQECLQSYIDGASIDDIYKMLVDLNKQLNNPLMFLYNMFWYCCEHLKRDQEKERIAVTQLIVKCTQEPSIKNVFPEAFKKYCKHLVEEEIEEDVPHLRDTFPDLVAHIMTCDHSTVSGKTLSNKEFVEGFKEFHEAGNMMFVRTLAKLVKIFKQRKEADIASIVRMSLDEFESADEHYKSEEMKKYMEKQSIEDENHSNLKALLDSA